MEFVLLAAVLPCWNPAFLDTVDPVTARVIISETGRPTTVFRISGSVDTYVTVKRAIERCGARGYDVPEGDYQITVSLDSSALDSNLQ